VSRVFDQTNTWGSVGGPDPQRADLWYVDFSSVIAGLNEQITGADGNGVRTSFAADELLPEVEAYYISSVSMPTLKVKAEEYRRDSRPYNMPGFDEAMTEIKVMFIMDTPVNVLTSKIHRFLEIWRAFVRAGRLPMGQEGYVDLGDDLSVTFRYPTYITLLRGCSNPKISNYNRVTNSLGGAWNNEYGTVDSITQQLAGLPEDQREAHLRSLMASAGLTTTPYDLVSIPGGRYVAVQLQGGRPGLRQGKRDREDRGHLLRRQHPGVDTWKRSVAGRP
jgi:hypothetical protein